MPTPFLEAEWRKLIMANYAVDPSLLAGFLPSMTELDLWNNTCYISLVGFMFVDTKIKGVRIPFHVNFEEVNLRFYVRCKDDGIWKRGVVFIKEIVPRPALSFVANLIYKEHYETMRMMHAWNIEKDKLSVEYAWKKGQWNRFKVISENRPASITEGSEEEFITEHYWGYTKINDGKTSEYGVEHPKWSVYPTIEYAINVDFGKVYGGEFSFMNQENPKSVFLAEGSEVLVRSGRILKY